MERMKVDTTPAQDCPVCGVPMEFSWGLDLYYCTTHGRQLTAQGVRDLEDREARLQTALRHANADDIRAARLERDALKAALTATAESEES